MNEAMTKGYIKFDIFVDVKTLCRKAKTTTWAQLVEGGFKIGDHEWGEDSLVIKGSGEGHARMGLLTSYLTDSNQFMNPTIAKAILPELDGVANGLGHIVLVGYKEGNQEPEAIITVLFEFKQQSGGKIKVSKSAQAYFDKEAEIKKTPVNSVEWISDLHAQLETYKIKHQGTPLVVFSDTPEVPAHLHNRKFSPLPGRYYNSAEGKRSIVIHLREHTAETEGITPPHLFSLIAEEGENGALWITYEGDADLTEEQNLTVKEVLFAVKNIVAHIDDNLTPPHGIIEH